MRQHLMRMAFGFSCLATTMFVLAVLATPHGAVVGEEPIEFTVCSDPNTVVCTNNDATNPTDCNQATKDQVCDKKDNKCVCRFSSTKFSCTCGYK